MGTRRRPRMFQEEKREDIVEFLVLRNMLSTNFVIGFAVYQNCRKTTRHAC